MDASSFENRIGAQLEALVVDTAHAHDEDPAAVGLVVALSGGPDSVALLHAAVAWARRHGRKLVVAHFNHRLRGQDSDSDQMFCHDLCDQLDATLVCGSGDPRAVARQRGRGLEDAARELRHQFLERVRLEHGLTAIATGHHRDDQAETVILRLFRGTGLDGLRALRPRSGRRIHPLLAVTRAEILEVLAAAGLPWRDDPSNHDRSNRRSRVRRELLPLVRDIFGEGSDLNPARLADLVETDVAYLDAMTEAALSRIAGPVLTGHSGASLAVAEVVLLPRALARRVVRRWLREALPSDLTRAHVDDVLDWFATSQSGTGLDLPGSVRLERVFDRAGIVGSAPPSDDATRWRLRIESLTEIPQPPPPPGREGRSWRLICPSEVLAGSLRLRNPRPGDRLELFGLAGSKKLSDLMQEKRIPTARRAGLLVVEDDAGILWVPEIGQAERTRVLPSTRQAVTISVDRRWEQPGE